MNSKKYIVRAIILLIIAFSPNANAQITSPGFVQQDIVKQAGVTNDAQMYALSPAYRQTTRTYIDGMGRAIQKVAVQASPLQNDMIQPAAYDNLGRQMKSYLPYAGKSTDVMGSYRAAAVTSEQPAFYNNTSQYLTATDSVPYTQQVIENSPLQRVLQAGMIGKGFQPVTGQHFKTVSYRPNSNALDGNIANTGTTGTFTTFYADYKLSVTDGINEDGAETLVFKDIAGRTILKRQVSGVSGEPYYDTYYIYNNAGAIKYIVPPKATHLILGGATLTTASVSNLIYTYNYDNMGRVSSKTAPGSGTASIIYDPLNRPVLSQDANQALRHQWNYIKYDAKDRPVMTGIYTDNTRTTPFAMQTYVNGLTGYNTYWYETRSTSATYFYYSNNVFPTAGTTTLSYNYYDNYDWNGDGVYDYRYKSQGLTNEAVPTTDSLKGAPTMTLKRTIGPGIATPIWLMTATFYDSYGHVIQVQSNNQLNYTLGTLTDTKTIVPDFIGKPLQTKVIVVTGTGTSNTNAVTSTLNYDVGNARLASIDQSYNSQASKHIAAYTYNELGQVVVKNLGYTGTKYLQTVDFRYNIRGQLLSINNSKLNSDAGVTNADTTDLFGMQLSYDVRDNNISNTISYSGRLTGVKWMSRDGSGNRNYERSYIYGYDKLARYTGSTYAERTVTGTGSFNLNPDGFDESGITYDDAGNILTLKRNSSTIKGSSYTTVDNLTYTYDGTKPNQLNNVADAGTNTGPGFINLTSSTGSYVYDSDGNLTTDPFKGLSLKYNSINRVDSIVRTASGTNGAYISYTYDAAGGMVRKQVYSTSTTIQSSNDYIGGFVYTTQSGATTLTYITNPEGRLMNTGGATVTLTPEYVITDQQGNARFSFEDNGSGAVVIRQETSYYAFGEVLASSSTPTTPNKNLYNGGAEWQNDFNNLPDYQQTFYRNYDPAIGRFIASDPMPESAESMTTYQYAGNNPVMMNDPMGNLYKLPSYNPQDSFSYLRGPNASFISGDGAGPLNLPDTPSGDEEYGGAGGGDYSDYWGAALSYLNDVASSMNATSITFYGNAVEKGALQEQLIADGAAQAGSYDLSSNGDLTFSAEQNNDSSSGEINNSNLSTQSQGMNLQQTSVYGLYGKFDVTYGKQKNPNNGNTLYGVELDIAFFAFDNNKFQHYQWIQTITSTATGKDSYSGPDYGNGTYPFYYLSVGAEEWYTNYYNKNSTAYFHDFANGVGTIALRTFQANVTLLGIDSQGNYTPLGSFSWGYTANGSNVNPQSYSFLPYTPLNNLNYIFK